MEDGIAAYQRAIELRPKDPELHLALGNAWRDNQDLIHAIGEYRRAVELKPTETDYRLALALALHQAGDYGGAIEELRRVIRAKPDLALAHEELASAYLSTGNHPAAIASYQEALHYEPKNPLTGTTAAPLDQSTPIRCKRVRCIWMAAMGNPAIISSSASAGVTSVTTLE